MAIPLAEQIEEVAKTVRDRQRSWLDEGRRGRMLEETAIRKTEHLRAAEATLRWLAKNMGWIKAHAEAQRLADMERAQAALAGSPATAPPTAGEICAVKPAAAPAAVEQDNSAGSTAPVAERGVAAGVPSETRSVDPTVRPANIETAPDPMLAELLRQFPDAEIGAVTDLPAEPFPHDGDPIADPDHQPDHPSHEDAAA